MSDSSLHPFPDAEEAWFWCFATWAAQMLAVAFVILDNPEKAPVLLNAVSSLDTIWTVGLSVLGIYVYKRSGEKRRQA